MITPILDTPLDDLLYALLGSAWLTTLALVMAVPVGVGAALWLEEYARPGKLKSLLEINITHIAGIPSILYGLLGLAVFVRALGFRTSLLAGALTLALLALPMVIMTAREALQAVPQALRDAALALGANRLHTLSLVVLPAALPDILAGVLATLARIAGETAPLLMLGVVAHTVSPPNALTALPLHIFHGLSGSSPAQSSASRAAIVVLLALTVLLHAAALWLRARGRARLSQGGKRA